MEHIDFVSGAVKYKPEESIKIERFDDEKNNIFEFYFKIQEDAVFIVRKIFIGEKLFKKSELKLLYKKEVYDLEDFFEIYIKKSFFEKYSYDKRLMDFHFNAQDVINQIKEKDKDLELLCLKEIKITLFNGQLQLNLRTNNLEQQKLKEMEEWIASKLALPLYGR